MKYPSLILLSLTLAFSLGACGRTETPATEVSQTAKSLLSHVPADTPYLAANLQPLPDEVMDAYFKRMEPVTTELQSQLFGMKSRLETGGESTTGDETMDRLLLALLTEFDGKLSQEGLESMGWDLRAAKVIYGDGAFPVVRLGLSDPAALRATVLRVLENAEVEAPELEFQGISYWRVAHSDTAEAPLAVYISILPDHLVAAIYPLALESNFLPGFLGLEFPAANDAAERIAALNQKYDLTPYGTGYLDLHRLADEFTDPQAATAGALISAGAYDLSTFDETCVAETHRLIDNSPNWYFGFTRVEEKAVEYRFLAEMPTGLAGQMAGLVAKIPAARAVTDRIAEVAFGMKVGAVRDFLREKANGIVANPFQCEHYADLNHKAEEALVKLDQPLPPFVNNFRGVRLSIKELEMVPGQEMPKDVKGYLAVHVDEPQMVVGMAQMFLPDLSEMQLAPGEDPARVPEFLMSYQGIETWAAMSDEAIGVSVGAGEQDGLVAFLEMDAGPEGSFFSADYDYGAYYDLQLMGMPGEGKESSATLDLTEVMIEAAKEATDRNHLEMKFTPEGLVIENLVTFK